MGIDAKVFPEKLLSPKDGLPQRGKYVYAPSVEDFDAGYRFRYPWRVEKCDFFGSSGQMALRCRMSEEMKYLDLFSTDL